MKILYDRPNDTREFDMEEYLESLHEFDTTITKQQVEQALKEFPYNPLHHSCLIEIGVNLIQNENQARAYFTKYHEDEKGFERLRRITGGAR